MLQHRFLYNASLNMIEYFNLKYNVCIASSCVYTSVRVKHAIATKVSYRLDLHYFSMHELIKSSKYFSRIILNCTCTKYGVNQIYTTFFYQ